MTLLINTMFITLSRLILVLVTLSDTVAQDFEPEQVYCGTAPDANLAGCENLLNNNDIWKDEWDKAQEFLHFDENRQVGFRAACHEACCVFVHDGPGETLYAEETIQREALTLLRCASRDPDHPGLVNGLGIFREGNGMSRHGICVANVDGISDCFTGKDFKKGM